MHMIDMMRRGHAEGERQHLQAFFFFFFFSLVVLEFVCFYSILVDE